MAKNTQTSAADAHGIKKLNDYLHLRIRTEMYLGSRGRHTQNTLLHTDAGPFVLNVTWVPALLTAFREVIDNSLDEFTKAGIKSGILKVTYDPDTMSFIISDNGRGIPIDWDHNESVNLASMVMSELKAGRNFNDDEREGVAGMNGLGGSCVTNIAEYFELEVVRGGRPFNDHFDEDLEDEYSDEELLQIEMNSAKNDYSGNFCFKQVFEEGESELIIGDPIIEQSKQKTTGTTITFTLSQEVFKEMVLPEPLIESLLREIAAANPNHKIYFNETLLKSKKIIEDTLFPKNNVIKHSVNIPGFVSDFFLVTDLLDEADETSFLMHGLVNNIPVFDGGNHLDEFKKRLALGLIPVLEKEGKRLKNRLKPNRSDIEHGLLIYNNTTMNAPYFNGQAKTKLINDEVEDHVKNSMDEKFFTTVVKQNKEWVDKIFERTAQRTNKKDLDANGKAAKRNLRNKVAKLDDAHFAGKAVKKNDTILFLTEGDSANNMSEVKNNKIHGTLPLRGKILNVMDPKVGIPEILGLKKKSAKATDKKDEKPKSSSTADIMNAIGLVPGEKAVRNKLRYGSICIATDMDPDGANIAALIVNFLYKYWPELFEDADNPFVYVFMTPFIILHKGKQREYFYLHDYEDFSPSDWKGWGVRRAKGLGTLQKADWKNAFDDLKVLPVVEDDNLESTLDLIFNKDRADDRKRWMMSDEAWDEWQQGH